MTLEEMRSYLVAPEIEPRQLLRCALAVRSSEIQAYFALLSEKRVRVEDMARKLGKSRATAQRLLQDLVSKGLAIRAESFIGRGGYLYEYRAVPPEKVKKAMKRIIDEWYEKMVRFLEEFPRAVQREAAKR